MPFLVVVSDAITVRIVWIIHVIATTMWHVICRMAVFLDISRMFSGCYLHLFKHALTVHDTEPSFVRLIPLSYV